MYLTIKLVGASGQQKSQVINDLSKFMLVADLKTKIEVGVNLSIFTFLFQKYLKNMFK